MKPLLIFLTTLICLVAQAQDKKTTQKILIGFNFSPDYSFRTLKNNGGGTSGDLVIKSRNDIEKAKFGYTTGVDICINFSHLAGFETGIQFSDKGYKTKAQVFIYSTPDPRLPTKATSTYDYHYIGIPLKARFAFGKNKVRFISGFGFMTNFLLDAKHVINSEYPNGTTEKSSQSLTGFNKVDISPMISIGIDQKLNNKIHVYIEPAFRYGVIKTIDASVTEHLWNAGINAGLYYALK